MLPLLRVIANEPGTLVEHATAYADLASDELQSLSDHWSRRLVWLIVAAVAALATLVLAGMAVMLWAVVPPHETAHAWLLVAVPVVPAIVALVALQGVRSMGQRPAFDTLRAQLREDLALVREGLAQ
ncbi:hypothetical protein [Methylibium sp.]|uniref:hypothetical protein n=1 Tax=Methylibium sp. TaxID=2067992 RepID=UPI003D09AF01